MGRPPAYIFLVRHGNRLDAADKQWQLSSLTPYDTPLTYGGWTQSKNVGAKIASVIRDQEAQDQEAEPSQNHDQTTPPPRKKKRYNYVIHSSPFLRCVQTSIAISAGLTAPDNVSSSTASSRKGSQASIVQPSTQTAAPVLAPIATDVQNHAKTVLRLDAFLGEWLSPDYYERITPPPKSDVMLATAKAELLRKENYNEYLHFQTRESPRPQGQLWGASPTQSSFDNTINADSDSVVSAMSDRASNTRGYTAPVTNYAISPNEPIPRGFVAHARDTCASIDYQWDSSRPDVAWGDGGELPEEWAAMHQRFRRGLKNLVGWYANTEQPGSPVTRMSPSSQASSPQPQYSETDSEDLEVEDVVIIVSHGAGCNALIGAVTQQPTLTDVAMSSISIAKRRSEYDATENPLSNERAASLDNALLKKRITLADVFEMKVTASTEHLSNAASHTRTRSSSLAGPHLKSGSRDQSNGSFSSLRDINFGSYYGSTSSLGRSNSSSSSSLGSMRRPSNPVPTINMRPSVYSSNSPRDAGITVGSGAFSFTPSSRPNRAGSIGLWQPREEQTQTVDEEPENNMLLNFGTYDHATNHTKRDEEPPTKKQSQAPSPINQAPSPINQMGSRDPRNEASLPQPPEEPITSTSGLWGSAPPSTDPESSRNAASKRKGPES